MPETGGVIVIKGSNARAGWLNFKIWPGCAAHVAGTGKLEVHAIGSAQGLGGMPRPGQADIILKTAVTVQPGGGGAG